MSVKFKIGFTITPEVLFGIIGKVLPLENLHIEQLIETPMPDPAIRFDRRFDLPKPKRKAPKYTKKRASIPLQLDRGINKILLTALKIRPHKAVELKPLLLGGNYSPNSVGSRLQALSEKGIVEKMQNSYWRLSVDELKKTYPEESA
jgi:hypothetical protein